MNGKRIFFSELAFVVGIITLAFGTALMERASFGVSMIVAPAYIIHLKVSQYLPFYTFGVSEYIFQGFLLILLAIVMRRFKKTYILSLVTAVVYGIILDIAMGIIGLFPYETVVFRGMFFVIGLLLCTFGIALLFRTYLPTEAYELFVKEVSQKSGASIPKTKIIYDFSSCIFSIVLSFCFFGFGVFVGIEWGTIISTLLNGYLIGKFGHLLEKRFVFEDAFPWREKF